VATGSAARPGGIPFARGRAICGPARLARNVWTLEPSRRLRDRLALMKLFFSCCSNYIPFQILIKRIDHRGN